MKIKSLYKIYIFLIIGGLTGLKGFSQQKFSNFPIRINNPQEAFAVVNTNGDVGYVFEGNRQYQVIIINPMREVEKIAILNKSSERKKDKIVGAVLNDNAFSTFLLNEKTGIISSVKTNRATGEYQYYKLAQMGPGDQFLRAFTYKNTFYFLTVPKHSNNLKVLQSSDGSIIYEDIYPIEMTTFYTALSSSNELLNEPAESTVGIEVVKAGLENNIKSSFPKKKLYYHNDKLFFTFDEPHFTHLVEIDLINKKPYYKKLNFSLEKGNNSSTKRGNSFIQGPNLFRTTISQQQLNVSIVNLDSMKLVNTYNIYPDEEINILNGPMVQEGGTSTLSMDEKVIKKTSQYFNRVLNGNIAIAANKLDSAKYEVEVGSYEEFVTRNGTFGGPSLSVGMGMGMGMGGMGMGFGSPFYSPWGYSPYGFGSGFYGYPGYYPYNSNYNTRLKIVSFKTLLKEESFKHINGEVPKTLRQQISDYFDSNYKNHAPDLYIITGYGDYNVLLGSLHKGDNKFEIVELRK